MARLGDYVSIKTGKLDANASSLDGMYPFFTCAVEPLKIDTYSYDCECVLVAGNGDLNVKYYNGKFDAYQRTYIIESTDSNKLTVPYLYFFLEKYVETLRAESIGGVIKYIKLGNLTEAAIRIPKKAIQDDVVATFSKLSHLTLLRKQQLSKLDELVKSRFIEMFGDCEQKLPLATLCSIITDGTHQPPRFQEKGIPFIFVSNLSTNKVTYNAEKYISNDTYNALIKRTPIEKGDVLLSTVGSYGHPAVVVEDTKFLFQRHIAYLKPNHTLINSFYLHSALLAPDGQRQIEEKVKGIAQKTLNLSEIKRIMIPLPSLQQQTQFAALVAQVDKSKFEIQKSLDKLETLKNALTQKYFG